jgi:quinolinate synthase
MIKNAPEKRFIPAPPMNNCACNDCPHMKRNTLQKLHDCMLNESPEILLEESIRLKAEKSIQRMLELSVNL